MEKNISYKKEVSCVALSLLLKYFLTKKPTLDNLLSELKFSKDFILDENNWIDFETFKLIVNRFKYTFSEDPDILFKMGCSVLEQKGSYGFIRLIMLLNTNPIMIYEKFPYFVRKSFTFVTAEFQKTAQNKVRLIYSIADNYPGAEDIFQVAMGLLTVMPEAVGFRRSKVEMREMKQKAIFDIEVFPRKNIFSRFWESTLGKLKVYRQAINELEESSRLLEEKYDQLKTANSQIDFQVKELKALLSISEIINVTFNGRMEFKSILQDVKKNLNFNKLLFALYHPEIDHLSSITFIGPDDSSDYLINDSNIEEIVAYENNRNEISPNQMVHITTVEVLKKYCPKLEVYFQSNFFHIILFRTKMEAIGIIGVDNFLSKNQITEGDINFLKGIINQIIVGIDKTIYYNIIDDLNKNLEKKVTERTKELEEAKGKLEESVFQLKKLDRLKSDFVANVNHELKHPLVNLKLPLDSMLEGEFGELPKTACNAALIMKKSVLRLQKLIDDLLEYSKIEADKMFLNLESLDIQNFLDKILEEIHFFAEKKGILIKFIKHDVLPRIYFDPEKIEKIILNLLSNSLKFTPQGGEIIISVEDDLDKIKINFSDTGIGISEEDLKKIFDRFVQIGKKKEYHGTGIGLALSKELAELHSGTLDAKSTEGKGSTFTLTLLKGELPVINWRKDNRRKSFRRKIDQTLNAKYNKEAFENTTFIGETLRDNIQAQFLSYLSPEIQFDSEENVEILKNKKILIVEDNADTAQLLEFFFIKKYQVFLADNGNTGFEKALQINPDLVITDIMMPVMDGVELCKKIKSSPETNHIPVIILTARANLEDKITGLGLGADDYINKPFEMSELRIKVKSLLHLRDLHAQLKQHSLKQETLLMELKETQLKLIQSEKMAAIGGLVAGIAHEFNNPLAIVKAHSHLLFKYFNELEIKNNFFSENKGVLKDFREIENVIKTTIERLINLVRELKNLSYIQKTVIKKHDANKIIEDTLKEIDPETIKNIDIKLDLHAKREIECASIHFKQIIYNLIKNSIDSIDEAGKKGLIVIKTSDSENDIVKISFKDNGTGMKPDIFGKIYDPFFTTKPPGKGFGLGLTIVNFYLMKYNASISFNTEAIEGAEFIINFPSKPN